MRNQRAAAHQASLAEAATSALVSPSPRPPCLHPSPPPASGRRIVTTLARVDVPTFSALNVDDASSPTPPPLPPPLLRPPFCFSNCPEDHHCPNCRRCAFLCVEHNGDPCDPDNKDLRSMRVARGNQISKPKEAYVRLLSMWLQCKCALLIKIDKQKLNDPLI